MIVKARGHTELRLIGVFRPPLTGREIHDREGTYPAPREGADPPVEE